jgi:hypothetical protein
MATDLQKPRAAEQSTGTAATPAGTSAFARPLQAFRTGRALLACTRWGVVFALVATGYFGAAAVHAGLREAPSQQQILAASRSQQ